LTRGATVLSSYGSCTSPKNYDLTGQPDATYTFSVRAIDGAGNVGPAATSDYQLDSSSSSTPTITASPNAVSNDRNPAWSFTGALGAARPCQVARGSTVLSVYATCTGPRGYDLTGQPDGTYTFSVRAVDAAGNVSQAATSDYAFDTTAPAAPSIDTTPGSAGN